LNIPVYGENEPMKIFLAQINTIVGNIKYNTERILASIEDARKKQADLVIFPELAITGYPPRDLLLQNAFIEENLRALEKVSKATTDIGAIVGFVDRNPAPEGKGIFNAAALCADGRILSRHYKTLLPTYDVAHNLLLSDDKLQVAMRYHYASSSDDYSLDFAKRYEQPVTSGKGDSYNALYLGLNYYLYQQKLKIMGGIEYFEMDGVADTEDVEFSNINRSVDGWNIITGIRLYF